MHRPLILLLAAIALVGGSCGTDTPSAPPVVPPPEFNPAALVRLTMPQTTHYLGWEDIVIVRAWDADTQSTHADGVVLSTSNPGVVSLSAPVIGHGRANVVPPARSAVATVTMVGVGETFIRAVLNGVTDSIKVKVVPIPDVTQGLVVDSFEVIEYDAACTAPSCYNIYAPIIKVRSADASVLIKGIRVDYESATTGWCSAGDLPLPANSTAHLVDMTQYLWFNALLLFQGYGNPLPPQKVKVSVLFSRHGVSGLSEAQGVIHRSISNPVFPPSSYTGIEWGCQP